MGDTLWIASRAIILLLALSLSYWNKADHMSSSRKEMIGERFTTPDELSTSLPWFPICELHF
jgi:hypothetical protein